MYLCVAFFISFCLKLGISHRINGQNTYIFKFVEKLNKFFFLNCCNLFKYMTSILLSIFLFKQKNTVYWKEGNQTIFYSDKHNGYVLFNFNLIFDFIRGWMIIKSLFSVLLLIITKYIL